MLKVFRSVILFGFMFFALFIFTGCFDDSTTGSDNLLTGTVTFNFQAVSSDVFCYVFLDDDTDITNGYIKRIITPITSTVTEVDYSFDISDVPSGAYYLLGAYDFSDDPVMSDNTDPEAPPVWEAKGWYYGSGANPPASANVTDLSGVYDFPLAGLD